MLKYYTQPCNVHWPVTLRGLSPGFLDHRKLALERNDSMGMPNHPARPQQKKAGKSKGTRGRSSKLVNSMLFPHWIPLRRTPCSPHHCRPVSRSTSSSLKHELHHSACHWALNYARDLFTLKPAPRTPGRWLGIWEGQRNKMICSASYLPRNQEENSESWTQASHPL